jgi:MFS family permease
VTIFIALPLREAKGPPRPPVIGSRLAAAGRELQKFGIDAFRAFTGSRGAFVGLIFAVLPSGAYGLALALQSNLAVELGMSDSRIGDLALYSNIVGAAGCVIGGWMSDRLGRRKMLALFVASMSLPTLYLAWLMFDQQWIMPIDPKMVDRPVPAPILLNAFWITCLSYMFFNGLMYGARSAMFMDITTPAVAATQFTAYMACLNFVISYSATWQGFAIEHFGYPITLLLDGVVGIVPLVLLPWIAAEKPPPLPASAATAAGSPAS